ncbi:cysteine hydrolase family protein [Actinomycetospora cinnamomea]|uniref:Nicotinamidase-related amidase n=1 Tax=Actinomycetospora cinnamomea TaxID=663609 RepID=A0A2U1FLC0_9PSEU|nr:cysteine hydrolase family protein [Actinomycetospora cinnamomea]PVZ13015.1 nicotinamidase-related amidase [Actinomycetospora cinnamomea]
MTRPSSSPSTTLRELTGMPATPAGLRESALVMIDLQNTYTRGVMALEDVEPAIDEAAALLDRARSAGIPIVHVQHDAGEGTPYDVRADIGAIVDRVAPREGEHRIVKNFPNSFVGTDLEEHLRSRSAQNLVIAGFMTHMCVNSTARGAFNAGFAPTVVARATATRALPGPDGTVPAATLQSASLAALADMFAVVVPDSRAVPD